MKKERPYAKQPDLTPFLNTQQTIYFQQIVGTFLYFALTLDNTYLPGLNNIGTQQSQSTVKVQNKIQQLLDYANTHPNVALRFYTSDIQLTVDSDTAFLVLPKARNRITDYF